MIATEIIDRCRRNAEEAQPGFSDAARAFVLTYLGNVGEASGEQITDEAKAFGLVPHDDRAFGGVFLGLVKRGRIERAGYCPRRKGHGTQGGSIWRLRH